MNPASTATQLLGQLAEPFTAERLFDQLPDTVFFMKDAAGRYVCVNSTLVERCGLSDKSGLIGFLPSEVLGPSLGRAYEAQDQRVLETGQALTEQLELHPLRARNVGWCMTTKLPLLGHGGSVVGVVGVSQDLKMPDITTQDFRQIAAVIEFAESNLADRPRISLLASIAEMSIYQLDRRMQRVFGLTTGQWILKARLSRATELLLESGLEISQIALEAGYADQSAFTRQFRRSTGLTPTEYRRIHRCS